MGRRTQSTRRGTASAAESQAAGAEAAAAPMVVESAVEADARAARVAMWVVAILEAAQAGGRVAVVMVAAMGAAAEEVAAGTEVEGSALEDTMAVAFVVVEAEEAGEMDMAAYTGEVLAEVEADTMGSVALREVAAAVAVVARERCSQRCTRSYSGWMGTRRNLLRSSCWLAISICSSGDLQGTCIPP